MPNCILDQRTDRSSSARRAWMALVAAALVTTTATAASAADPQPLRYLLIDDHHVEQAENVQRVFHQPVKHPGPVVRPDLPWEEDLIQLRDPPIWSPERQRWQLWYWATDSRLPLYAESADGLTWTKPWLGLVKWNGSTENNLVDVGAKPNHPKRNQFALLRDDRDPDPARRYKALTMDGKQLKALVSADGLTWKALKSKPIPSGDTYKVTYDSFQDRFVATVKVVLPNKGRAVRLSFSEDFVSWTEPRLSLWADETDQELGRRRIEETLADPDRRHPLFVRPDEFMTDTYALPLFVYSDLYLGLPMMFHQSGKQPGRSQDGLRAPTLVASRDLNEWNRLSRAEFIGSSPLSDERTWDHGMLFATAPVRRGDELWFYYTGSRFTHLKRAEIEKAGLRNSPDEPLRGIFLARLRLDGFASLHVGSQPGLVLTKPLEVTGSTLFVNVDAREGELRAELRDPQTGPPLDGYSFADSRLSSKDGLSGDGTRIALGWKSNSDLSKLRGRKVQVTFSLRQADLYAFWFEDAVELIGPQSPARPSR